jgi:hypothetical protein
LLGVASVLLIHLVAVRPVQADPINITSGFLDMHPSSGPLVLDGDRGFSFLSSVDASGGVFTPWLLCWGTDLCRPGYNLDLNARWIGNDVTGPATLDEVSYPHVGSLSSPSSISVQFSGTAVLPPLTGSSTTIAAPFLFNGSFFHPSGDGFVSDALVGRGTATLTLAPSLGIPGTWSLQGARYSFADPSPAPTPEPGTLLLMGTGLIGLAAIVRRARKPPAP